MQRADWRPELRLGVVVCVCGELVASRQSPVASLEPEAERRRARRRPRSEREATRARDRDQLGNSLSLQCSVWPLLRSGSLSEWELSVLGSCFDCWRVEKITVTVTITITRAEEGRQLRPANKKGKPLGLVTSSADCPREAKEKFRRFHFQQRDKRASCLRVLAERQCVTSARD